jgi:hypothetical protein
MTLMIGRVTVGLPIVNPYYCRNGNEENKVKTRTTLEVSTFHSLSLVLTNVSAINLSFLLQIQRILNISISLSFREFPKNFSQKKIR